MILGSARLAKSLQCAMDLLPRAPRARPSAKGARRHSASTKALGFRAPPARHPRAHQSHCSVQSICSRAPLARPLAKGGTKVSSFDDGSWVPRASRAPLKIIAICNAFAHARPLRAPRQRGARRRQVLTKALVFCAPSARPPKSLRCATNLLTRAPCAPLGRGEHEGIKF